MTPSELKEYKAKKSRGSRESTKRRVAQMSPEERKAYFMLRNYKERARLGAYKFLSNMAKMGAAVKAIACSSQGDLRIGEKV